jgi:hypothetical protein
MILRDPSHVHGIVPDVDREEVHPAPVVGRDLIQRVLSREAVGPAGEPERDHEGPVEEVADADRALAWNLTRGGSPRVRGARVLGGGAIVLRDVRVLVEWAGRKRVRHRELGQRHAAIIAADPQRPPALRSDRVERGDDDQDEEGDPDERRIAPAGPPGRLLGTSHARPLRASGLDPRPLDVRVSLGRHGLTRRPPAPGGRVAGSGRRASGPAGIRPPPTPARPAVAGARRQAPRRGRTRSRARSP